MINFDNVTYSYPYCQRQVLKGATFCLQRGVNTILCDAKSGKSTICKLLVKDIAPTSGNIVVDGINIDGITKANLGILYLPRTATFFANKSVLDNVCYPLKVRKVSRQQRRQKALHVCQQLQLDGYLLQKVKSLPKTIQQQVALARGLTVPRNVVLLDDFVDGELQLTSIATLFADAIIVNVTSNPSLAVGNIVVMDDGKCIYQGCDVSLAKQYVTNNWLTDSIGE